MLQTALALRLRFLLNQGFQLFSVGILDPELFKFFSLIFG
ncbi:hypothetical protein AB93_4988 [Escherichia coli 5-172-05_S3_C1]|nr:hypothetical protein AD45_5034 [Escherichia coli 4-203-08_S4_C3]KEL05206.1 hypothetical protein AD19_4973 [Escherichia coli 4-203-08_S4_C2]KEL07472.1 hypothetical protein AC08_4823 [Escherichia coli 4-203-08_S3_C1]KEL07579.1 hypothetical protein AC08_4809 [Escherichia coli 4-203-08_S3_C1]KEL43437.1 hypothetical protein AB93_4988 [Escherichia coli 5-172-05_S3_C1]